MRKSVIVGNWKMNLSLSDAVALAKAVADVAPSQVDVGVAPSPVYIPAVAEALRGSAVGLSAQNMCAEPKGAFTGESSPTQLLEFGCSYVILGHSERRQLFSETDEAVANKARAAHDHGLTPILCVGETLEERESGRTLQVVLRQVEIAFSKLSATEAVKSVCAYEPVWAIGTGKTATPAQAQEVHRAIREALVRCYDESTANQIRIQYGGSVKSSNAAELIAMHDIDGCLVGGASLHAESFVEIIRICNSYYLSCTHSPV